MQLKLCMINVGLILKQPFYFAVLLGTFCLLFLLSFAFSFKDLKGLSFLRNILRLLWAFLYPRDFTGMGFIIKHYTASQKIPKSCLCQGDIGQFEFA